MIARIVSIAPNFLRRSDVFITSFLFIIKSSLSDSTAGRTPKEKRRRLDEVLVQEYDMGQVHLTSEINAEPKMFPCVFALFSTLFRHRTMRVSEQHAKNDV